MKRLYVLALLPLLSGCNEWRKLTGSNDTIINQPVTVTPGAGDLQHKTFVTHDGLTIYSDDRDYHETPVKIQFTPLSSTSNITVRASGTVTIHAFEPESPADITLYRDGLDLLDDNTTTRPYRLLSGASDCSFEPTRCVVETQAPVSLEFTEKSPGAGRTVTYAVRVRTGDAPPLPNLPPRYSVRWGVSGDTGLYSEISIEEWTE